MTPKFVKKTPVTPKERRNLQPNQNDVKNIERDSVKVFYELKLAPTSP